MNNASGEKLSQNDLAHKPISLEKAHATVWPFRPYKGQPMGTLVETKQLSFKDLGYAIETAWDERVRQAAIALMLVRLNQALAEPEPSAGALHVLSTGRSFSERGQLFLMYVQGAFLGTFFGLSVGIFIGLVRDAVSSPSSRPITDLLSSPTTIVASLIVVGLGLSIVWVLLRLVDKIINRLDRSIENYRRGQEGEERVVAAMHRAFDGNWFLFRNVVLPGRQRTDLDSVLVGPSGVWVLEIKNFTGEYKNTEEHWYYRVGNVWKPASSNPSGQAQKNAARLSNFLKADGVQQWIDSAVVWANPESPLTVDNPSVAVWPLERLPDELGNIWHSEAISEATRTRIVDKLTKLCEAQKEARK